MRLRSGQLRPRSRGGFTLVEMLVVIAILMILLGLLFVPMYQSFHTTKRAETITGLQDRVGTAMQRIAKDLEEAMYVYPPPEGAMYTTASLPDTLLLAFLDMHLPATEGEVWVGPGPNDYGNPDKIAYPLRPSEKIVRYFVAPLPGQAETAAMWGDPALGLGAYVNPYTNAFADPGSGNMAALYRAEFTLADLELAGGFGAGTLSYADVADPFFYTGQLSSVAVPDPNGLGRYWRTVSTALTNPKTMDCALYEYAADIEDEKPVLLDAPAGFLPGPLPGFYLQPTIVPGEVIAPSSVHEATAYRAKEQFWSNLDLGASWGLPVDPLMQLNTAGPNYPLPEVDYTAEAAATWTAATAGDLGNRLLPQLNATTGELRFARNWTDTYFETAPGTPDPPPDGVGCLQVGRVNGTLYPHVYRVGYGLFRGDPPAVTTPLPALPPTPTQTVSAQFNERDARFKVVEESEVVQIRDVNTGQVIQCERVEDEPVSPFQYRFDYTTGILRFHKLNYPDPTVFEIWVSYDYRDNFEWDPTAPKGYVDDTLMVTYVSRREMTVGLNVTAYDVGSGEAIPMSVPSTVRLRNAIR